MTLRVVQWATGNVGRAAVEAMVSHPELEVVGAWVHSKDKAGRDVGELCGIERLGVSAADSIDDILALKPDCVLYAPLLPNQQEVTQLLQAGVNVVTPLNWFYPGQRDVDALRAACEKGGATLHGTGIHPGGITERLPLTVAALSRAVTHVRAEEFSDIRSYGAADVIRNIMLFGKTPEQAKMSPMLMLLTEGFSQSIEMIADAAITVLQDGRVLEYGLTNDNGQYTLTTELIYGAEYLITAMKEGCTINQETFTPSMVLSVEDEDKILPSEFYLDQNYPNPFNPATKIGYTLPARSDITLDIVNILGQIIKTISILDQPSGYHTIVWNGTDDQNNQMPSGIYFSRLKTDDMQQSRKMILIK